VWHWADLHGRGALVGRQGGDGHSPRAFGPMPLIDGMTATSKVKAFVLGSLFASLVATSAVQTRHVLEVNAQAQRWSESAKTLATLAGSFVLSLLAYFLLWVVFGYGGGMEISEPPQDPLWGGKETSSPCLTTLSATSDRPAMSLWS